MNAVFYGFQFPHHGKFSAFSALSREFDGSTVHVSRLAYPEVPGWLPGRARGPLVNKWCQLNEYRLRHAFRSDALVHYFFPENSLFQAPQWKKSGPLVLSGHQPMDHLMELKNKGLLSPFFEGMKAADAVVLMASCEMGEYRELAPNSEVLCIPHGVDTNFFSPAAIAPEPGGKFRILTVGNWLRDYDLWAEVVERVVSECPEVEFSVLANPDRLKAATETLKTGRENIRSLCGISDEQLREEYCRADVVFLPLKDAWANNALLESMSCGRPLLATDLPAIREYAGEAACFAPKGDADAAAQSLLYLREHPEQRAQLGRQARVRMVAEYGWEQIAQKHLALYADLSA